MLNTASTSTMAILAFLTVGCQRTKKPPQNINRPVFAEHCTTGVQQPHFFCQDCYFEQDGAGAKLWIGGEVREVMVFAGDPQQPFGPFGPFDPASSTVISVSNVDEDVFDVVTAQVVSDCGDYTVPARR